MKFSYTKFGLKHDPRGAQVTLEHQGRTMIGDVVGCYRDDFRGATFLKVRHFNGEMWPIEPCAITVEVLERRPS